MKGLKIAMALLLQAQVAIANPGDLDTTFGTGGTVITAIGSAGEQANALVQQADGKLVAAGSSVGSDSDFALVRYETDGTLDVTFGTGGEVTTDFGGQNGIRALVVQPDGKLVAAGQSGTTGARDFALARYNPDGSLDTSFGSGGIVTTSFSSGEDIALALVLQPDGKLVAAGQWEHDDVLNQPDFALARYNPDGSLDATFGVGGKVTAPVGSIAYAAALVLQSDGKLVAAGRADADFGVARYNADGSLDTSFGSGGVVTTDFGGSLDSIAALAQQSDGKLVAAGIAFGSSGQVALARYNLDGSLDSSFGTGGKVIALNADASALVVQTDSKLVVAGGTSFDAGLFRFNPDGSSDTSFGAAGVVLTSFGSLTDTFLSLIQQSDGKLVGAGRRSSGSGNDFALARYHAAWCGDGPAAGCNASSGKGVLLINNDGVNALRKKVVFKWLKGNTDVADLGDPTAMTDYSVCVYDNTGGVVSLSAAAGESCVSDGCWRLLGPTGNENGIRYLDPAKPTTHDGIKRMLAKASSAGKAKVLVTARGENIPTIGMSGPLVYPVTAQVLNSDGQCWEQQFVSGDEKKNDGVTFRAVHQVP